MSVDYNDGQIHGWNGGEYSYEVFQLVNRLVLLTGDKNDAIANTARDLLSKWDKDRGWRIS